MTSTLESLVIALTLAAPPVTPADVTPVPDSARIERVQFELRHFDDLRVHTDEARLSTHRMVATPEGVQLGRIIEQRGMTSSPQLVSWAEVDSIQARDGTNGTGMVLGALAGLAIALTIEMARTVGDLFSLEPSKDNSVMTVALGIGGGMALGWLIDQPGRWQTIYP